MLSRHQLHVSAASLVFSAQSISKLPVSLNRLVFSSNPVVEEEPVFVVEGWLLCRSLHGLIPSRCSMSASGLPYKDPNKHSFSKGWNQSFRTNTVFVQYSVIPVLLEATHCSKVLHTWPHPPRTLKHWPPYISDRCEDAQQVCVRWGAKMLSSGLRPLSISVVMRCLQLI